MSVHREYSTGPLARRSLPAPIPAGRSLVRAECQYNSPEGESGDEGRTPEVRRNGWLSHIEDEDSVPMIRHRLLPTFGNQAPSICVDKAQVRPVYFVRNCVTDVLLQECARATRQLFSNPPSLSLDEKRLSLLKEKARLLDELAKLQLNTA